MEFFLNNKSNQILVAAVAAVAAATANKVVAQASGSDSSTSNATAGSNTASNQRPPFSTCDNRFDLCVLSDFKLVDTFY
jgi:hypothetical protein